MKTVRFLFWAFISIVVVLAIIIIDLKHYYPGSALDWRLVLKILVSAVILALLGFCLVGLIPDWPRKRKR